MPEWADRINSFIRQDYKPYYGKDTLLDDGSRKSGARNVTGGIRKSTDSFDKLLQSINKMPARPRRAPRRAPRRSAKRKAPRGKKKTYKRKATIRKSTKRKKRKVSKGVSLTVGTARERRVDHILYGGPTGGTQSITTNKALYIPMNSLGPKDEMLQMVAQSLLLHYMHRVGDYRANVSMVPIDASLAAASAQSTTWSLIRFHFVSPAVTDDQSVFDVWSYYDGTSVAEQTLKQMTERLALGLLANAKLGKKISQVTVYRDVNSPTSGDDDQCILIDISAGRNILEFTCKASLKMQNTTHADVQVGHTSSCGVDNALNINRNPLDGFVYKFRNSVPKYKMQYLISKTDTSRLVLDNLTDVYSTHEAGIDPIDMTLYGDEWFVPPPAPSTIFSNFAGKTGISMSPGGHATQSMYESYKGSVNSFFTRYFAVLGGAAGNSFDVPPGGSSLLICLKPKYRNAIQASISIEAEIDHTYCARVSRAKLTPLPMNTVLA
jgi:hypothetical protein